jgi:hypothetical protein
LKVPPSSYEIPGFQVLIGHLAATSLTEFSTAPQTVVRAASPFKANIGWSTIAFSSTFTWDGTSGIVLQVCHAGGASGAGSDMVYLFKSKSSQVVTNYSKPCSHTTKIYDRDEVPEILFNF